MDQIPSGAVREVVRLLVPDLPDADSLVPYLRKIDQNRRYTNFGPLVRQFEDEMAAFLGDADGKVHCVTLASGTAALELALDALELPPRSRVLVPAFTFPATVSAVLFDAAAALGATRIGRHSHAVFSLHATKPFGIGEGGLLATRDAAFAERVRRSGNFGFSRGCIERPGTNAKLSEYAAAVGRAQRARWPAMLARRLAVWEAYRARLSPLDEVALQQGFDVVPPAALAVRIATGAGPVAELAAKAGTDPS